MSLSAQNVTKGMRRPSLSDSSDGLQEHRMRSVNFQHGTLQEKGSHSTFFSFFFLFFERGSALSAPDLSIHLYRLFGEPTQKPVWWCVDIRLERLNNDRSCGFLLASPFPFHRSLFLSQTVYIYLSIYLSVYISIYIYSSVVKNKPPRKALAENLGPFMPTCCFSLIFISFIHIYRAFSKIRNKVFYVYSKPSCRAIHQYFHQT